jgi:hypothetical protein
MSDTAFQTQFREEYVQAFEQHQSLLRESTTQEVMLKGQIAEFLVAGSGGATAVTRGVNGRIPGRPDNLVQNQCTLTEWHDKPERTGFNIFASQSDGRRIMQMTSLAVLNRQIDTLILNELANATVNTGAAVIASLRLVTTAITTLGNAAVPMDGRITAVISPAFMAYLHELKEFGNALYVNKKPLDGDDAFWKDKQGYYDWMDVKWIVHPNISGIGTNAEKCFMFHESAIGFASPGELIRTAVGYNEEHDYSYAHAFGYMGAKLLQNSGVVVLNHDGSALNV